MTLVPSLEDDSISQQLATLTTANSRLSAENSVLQSYLARHASVREGAQMWRASQG